MAEQDLLTVSVVTPDGSVYEGQTRLAVFKTTVGEIGILPNHIPLIASLEIDEVRVKVQGTDDKFDEIAVSGGFVEFSDNVATVVANSAEKKENIDKDRAAKARERAERRLEAAKQSNDINTTKRAEIALRRAVNRMNISGH
ncbi:F0F1 ATP synthase subunit epsilon [Liquorilactobacillus mali]|uniref:ATP synthase epsilon chain n=1 Tax=Liquorilactobacillus mali KCTC 3596 = DSM 20444 TaxID=1046596 RepID=J0URD8_9LACO|nr:F0F1 ATP synthase subunit epsilon [Liquorilactobacillus mali]EJE98751.1 ATP synthase epsilon chain [Liquorilactobacillus mali KCTC 3596 = DSM 20444]KRN10988.1 ATP synthase epsilon chain [Liquorilactobacillus mali KCTC 3596 = DSM 20444]MDC7952039.1 F0F1 ATP synthase subunit epsilon [Liquorilactobacillus mali]QFQ74867.1 F0F1 ATP synthase subunit epsilon [Liquorilactobacillus mali]